MSKKLEPPLFEAEVVDKNGKRVTRTALRHHYVMEVPDDVAAQNMLANEMIEWAEQDSSWYLEDFPTSKRIAPCHFFRVAESNDYFAKALDIAKNAIGGRIVRAWKDGVVDKTFAMKNLAFYNETYRQMNLERHRITEEARHKSSIINVMVPPIGAVGD